MNSLLTIVSAKYAGTKPEATDDVGLCLEGHAEEDFSRPASGNQLTVPRTGGRQYFPVNIALNINIQLDTKTMKNNRYHGFVIVTWNQNKLFYFTREMLCQQALKQHS